MEKRLAIITLVRNISVLLIFLLMLLLCESLKKPVKIVLRAGPSSVWAQQLGENTRVEQQFYEVVIYTIAKVMASGRVLWCSLLLLIQSVSAWIALEIIDQLRKIIAIFTMSIYFLPQQILLSFSFLLTLRVDLVFEPAQLLLVRFFSNLDLLLVWVEQLRKLNRSILIILLSSLP